MRLEVRFHRHIAEVRFLHLARVVLIICHTSQFGPQGKCVNTSPFGLESLAPCVPTVLAFLYSAQGSSPAPVTTEGGFCRRCLVSSGFLFGQR